MQNSLVDSLRAFTPRMAGTNFRERMIAALGAQRSDIENAVPMIAAAPVTAAGDTVASVLAYARATYTPTPPPGRNPAAVTDAHLEYALRAVPGLIPVV